MRNVPRVLFFLRIGFLLLLDSPFVRSEINITIECDASGTTISGSPCEEPPPGENGGLTNGGTGDAPIGQKTPNLFACKDGDCTQVPVGSGDHSTPTTPEGWDGPDSPPSTADSVQYWQVYQTFANKFPVGGRSTKTQACVDGVQEFNSSYYGNYDPANPNACEYYSKDTGAKVGNLSFYQMPAQCPAGYTLTNGTCTLSDAGAVKWPPDGTCSGKRDGNTWVDHPRDPDCTSNGGSSGSSVPAGFTKSGTNDQISGSDTAGKSVSAKQNADGSITVKITSPNADGKTSSEKTIQLGAPGSDGLAEVTGKSEGNIPGQGSLAGQGPQQGGTLDCPDCAKEGTLKALKDEITRPTTQAPWTKPNKTARDPIDKKEEIDAKKTELRNLLTQIRTEAAALLTANVGGGAYSCAPLVLPVIGAEFDICLNRFLDELEIIGLGLLLLAYLIAFYLVVS